MFSITQSSPKAPIDKKVLELSKELNEEYFIYWIVLGKIVSHLFLNFRFEIKSLEHFPKALAFCLFKAIMQKLNDLGLILIPSRYSLTTLHIRLRQPTEWSTRDPHQMLTSVFEKLDISQEASYLFL